MASLRLPLISDRQADRVHAALRNLGQGLTQAFDSPVPGDPEDQLKSHLRPFIERCGQALGFVPIVAKTESRYAEVGGRPDLGIAVRAALTGHMELKAPGRGANPSRFKGREREQWNNFQNLPNLIYTEGAEWTLFRTGQRIAGVRLSVDLTADGAEAATVSDAKRLADLLRTFLTWQPIVPATARQLAEALAPLARLLRGEVLAALEDEESAVSQLRQDWRSALFADADTPQFADAYAQTLTYALLLARLDGLQTVGTGEAAQDLLRRRGHALLADVLRNLADPQARREIDTPVDLLERVIGAVDVSRLRRGDADPWLYFYEDFLSAYDPELRRKRGVYYTPVQVVRTQVRLVGELLQGRFGKELTYADDGVVTLDPAAGTGTYPLAAIEHALSVVAARLGEGAVPGHASALARNVHAFEILVGPYAVAHLRVTERIQARGGVLPDDGAHVYLSDTLESPQAETPGQMALSLRMLAEEHERARRVKAETRVLVCLSNPPYHRQVIDLDDPDTQRKGGWVRFGYQGIQREEQEESEVRRPLLDDFLQPARRSGAGEHLKNVYNDYVYFWRWALWKVFDSTAGPGIVSFITASSYLRGPGFVGMREVMRRTFDELWIIDLEGGSLGARQTENVFIIKTPVAIAVGMRYGHPKPNEPAAIRYVRLTGTAEEKLAQLDQVKSFADLEWQTCFKGWQEPLLPEGSRDYRAWPLIKDLFPWQQSGVKVGRTWPVGSSVEVLEQRWRALVDSVGEERRRLFKDSPTGKRWNSRARRVTPDTGDDRPIAMLDENDSFPGAARMAFRSLDRHWVVADGRLMDRSGPPLWSAHSNRQVYLTSLLTGVLGLGPAATVAADVPDLHHFRGSFGGKDVIPLWRDADASEPNVTRGLVEALGAELGYEVGPADLFAYCYALLASPAYVDRFSQELTVPGPRVPLTKDPELFRQAAALGSELIRLHTYGERFNGADHGRVPQGAARCVRPIGETPDAYPERYDYNEIRQTLRVAAGRFVPVSPEVWEFSVSGLHVADRWLAYRMRDGAGRKSSPLDDIRPQRWTAQFTRELLELLWVLEATVERQPALQQLLADVIASPTFPADELPQPSVQERQAPRVEPGTRRGGTYEQAAGLG